MGRGSPKVYRVDNLRRHSRNLEAAAEAARDGAVVVFPAETGHVIAAVAENAESIEQVYSAGGRHPGLPLDLYLADFEEAQGWVSLPPEARDLASIFLPGPLTLVLERSQKVPSVVTAGTRKLGVRVPRHPLGSDFLQRCRKALAGFCLPVPSTLTGTQLRKALDEQVEAILEWREPPLGLEPTVLDLATHPPRVTSLGFVTVDELTMALGRPPLLSGDTPTPARFTRFAPEARLVVVEGNEQRVPRRLRLLAETYSVTGEVALILSQETARASFPGMSGIHLMGSRSRPGDMGEVLFQLLDQLEADGSARVVLVEGLPREGEAAVFMERLVRTAHQVINTENPGYSGQGGLGAGEEGDGS